MGKIERYDVSEEWAHSGIIKAGDLCFLGYCVGNIGGTIVGAFVIGVINDGMTMCGVTEFYQKVIRGIVIILAVIIDQVQRNLQAKMALQARNENK